MSESTIAPSFIRKRRLPPRAMTSSNGASGTSAHDGHNSRRQGSMAGSPCLRESTAHLSDVPPVIDHRSLLSPWSLVETARSGAKPSNMALALPQAKARTGADAQNAHAPVLPGIGDTLMPAERTSLTPRPGVPPTPAIPELVLPVALAGEPSVPLQPAGGVGVEHVQSGVDTPSNATSEATPREPTKPVGIGYPRDSYPSPGSIPNSLKDLRSIARSVESSTLHPGLSLAGSTLRPWGGLGPGLRFGLTPVARVEGDQGDQRDDRSAYAESSYGRQMRQIERELQQGGSLGALPVRVPDGGSSFEGSVASTLRGLGLGPPIDEVAVEWCFLCGKERSRSDMHLQRVILDLAHGGRPPQEASWPPREGEQHTEGTVAEDEREREANAETSWQWVCRGGC
ncbi:hypothetical protein IAU60_005388 [Kwoniella sp. DSM 27419]